VRELSARDAPTRALVRSLEKAAMFDGLPLEIVQGDLENAASVSAALEGVDRLFLLTAVPHNQRELEGRLLDAALDADVQHVVKLSASNVSESSEVNFFRWHREIERRIEESGVDWTHVQPNNFFQNTLFQLDSIREQSTFYGPFGNGRVASVDARDVAAVAATVLTGPEHRGSALELTGPEAITHDEMARALSNTAGREISYVDLSLDEFRASLLDMGRPEYFADGLTTLYGQLAAGAQSHVTTTIEEVTGHPARSFAEFVSDHVDVLTT
jgi:uncharacterized protein YbjT (DUF2867 family)